MYGVIKIDNVFQNGFKLWKNFLQSCIQLNFLFNSRHIEYKSDNNAFHKLM